MLARELAPAKPSLDATVRDIERLLALDRPPGVPFSELSRVPSEGAEIIAVEVPTARGVWAPAFIFAPRRAADGKPVLVLLEPRGRVAHWREGELSLQLAAAGTPVCALDVRGTGDVWPEVGRGNRFYTIPHSAEEEYAWASLILGKPLVGQRVTDILAFVRALDSIDATRGRRVVLAALGQLTVPALFSAALEPRIDSVYLAGGLVSFRSVLDTDEYKHPTANVLPNLLRITDLPAVAGMAAPRRIILAGTVDGSGNRMQAAAVQSLYARAANVQVREDGIWDFDALSAL
jgi:hypothetical protein